MAATFYYDNTQHAQAQSPAGAVQCLRNSTHTSLGGLWGSGAKWPNLIYQNGSGALLMLGRTDELAEALTAATGTSDIDGIWCSDDTLVVYYFRCHIKGTGALGLAGHTYTAVSVAPLQKYWGHTRQSLRANQGCGGWWPMYPSSAADQDIFNGGIYLAWIRDRVRQVDPQPAFQGYQY